MEANYNTSFIWAKKLLSCILLIIIYSWTPMLTFAQVEKADAQVPIPVVSKEVYQAIAQFYEYDRNISLDRTSYRSRTMRVQAWKELFLPESIIARFLPF